MSNKERKEIFNKIPHKIQDTRHQTEIWDYYALQTEETENRTKPKFEPQELPCTPTPKQTYLEATLSITKIKPVTSKKLIMKNKKRKQEQILKITDAWKPTNEKQKCAKSRIKKKQKQIKWKEYKGDHDEVCDICNKGGELILCYTGSRCNHWECDKNMPMHVHSQNIIYRCPICTAENGSTVASKTEEKHKWYTTTANMNITEAAKHMNTSETDYLHFMRKCHPWGTKTTKKNSDT